MTGNGAPMGITDRPDTYEGYTSCVKCGNTFVLFHYKFGDGKALCTECFERWKAEGGAATAWPEGLTIGGDTDGGTPDVYHG